MKKLVQVIVLASMAGLGFASTVLAQSRVDETPRLWFVEMKGEPTATGGKKAALNAQKAAFRSKIRAAGLVYRERYAYSSLFNGFSMAMTPSQMAKLRHLPDVAAVYGVEQITLPTPVENLSPEMVTALSMTGADIARNELGLDGTGIRVAVMDTGIDIDHPDFGGSGTNRTTSFPTARVVTGYDFVGDAFNGSNTPVPDSNPDDCGGHGTHVAGIVGANGVVKGVAPKVVFGAYRVFGCEGSTTADIMLAAMERALADNMQVLNMSIGASFQWPQYPTAVAASRLTFSGMVVVASIGNSGTSGLYAAGAPGLGDRVIGVASFDNTGILSPAFTISPDNLAIGFNPATGSPAPPTSGTVAMARTGTQATTNDACAALVAGSLTGKIALIRRGTCSFNTKASNAQNAGAVGVVLYNNVAGSLSPTVVGPPNITIPVVAISGTSGAVIDSRLAAGAVSLTWTTQQVSVPNPTGGLISSFSSYGLSPDLALKPDIGAPGGSIYSTWPLELGGFASLSGTSMSSPHVAGAVALLLQAAPGTPAWDVLTLLQNSATPKPWSLNPGAGFLDHVHRQGAGMLQIDKSILATTRVEPSKLTLGESQAGPTTRTLSISNKRSTPVTYTLSFVNALSTGSNTFTPSFAGSDASVAFSAASVTVPGGSSVGVTATITPPTGPMGGIYGGYLVLTPSDASQTYRVPFAGYIGDYQSRQVMTPTANNFPWLAKLSGGSYFNQTAGATYTMVGTDIPYFLIHFDHPARQLKLEVIRSAGFLRAWIPVFDQEFLARHSATGFSAFGWDGVAGSAQNKYDVPNGTYIVRLSVLKALGDEANPAHWETWSSSVITVARP